MASCGICGSTSQELPLESFPRRVAGKFPNATWMGDLVERGGTKATLKRLVIPGSHDSASYSFSKFNPLSSIGRTQNLTVREQLLSGVRFLDLRIASGKGDRGVNIYHGRLMGGTFEEVLDEIRGFCQEFPTEFVVLEVVAEYGRPFSAKGKLEALGLLQSHFSVLGDNLSNRKPLLCKVKTRNEMINTSLPELIQKHGRVCVLLHPRIYGNFLVNGVAYTEDFVKKEFGFFESTQWLRNKWHETNNPSRLMKRNLAEIRFHKAEKRRYFVNNQFVLTPTVKGNCLGFLRGETSLQPWLLVTRGLYGVPKGSNGTGIPNIHKFFLEHPEEDWNLVSLDFVDLAPSIVELCIGVNCAFGPPLDIKLALLPSAKDVTELVRSKILRKCCLFLHPLHDFGGKYLSNPDSSLTIVYKLSGKLYTIVIPLSISVIVLNEHNHVSAGGTELSIGDGTQGNGTFAPRNSGVTVTWQKTEDMSFRFGYLDKDVTKKNIDACF